MQQGQVDRADSARRLPHDHSVEGPAQQPTMAFEQAGHGDCEKGGRPESSSGNLEGLLAETAELAQTPGPAKHLPEPRGPGAVHGSAANFTDGAVTELAGALAPLPPGPMR